MVPIKIRILNPKALALIKGMEDLKLIAVEEESPSEWMDYLATMRKKSGQAPSLKEIGEIVEEVRTRRYAGK